VLNVNKIKGVLQTIYHQVIKGPINATIRSFKQQWEQLPENVGSVLMEPQPALAGVGGPTSRMWMSGAERGTKGTTMNIVGRTGASKGIGKADPDLIRKIDVDFLDRMEAAGGHTIDRRVSKTNEELIKRAIQEDAEAATTFTNKQIAIKAIQENLRKNADDIAKWLNESDTGRKIFDVSHNHPIGKGVLRDKKHVVYNLTNSRVVLIRDSTQELGFRILTAFPIVK
ncbi:RNase A-like domain-containing protein, partial [Saccharococcus caldoxylosilyticus]